MTTRRIMDQYCMSPPLKTKMYKWTEAKNLQQEEIASGKWLSLNKITYKDPKGSVRTWESVQRTTRQADKKVDAVVVIPTLKTMYKFDRIILVKQYRPPLGCCTIEFPAGLIDKGETTETAALRELKEETGYTARVKHCSPATSLDAGVGSSTVSIVTVEIDGDQKINKRPCQESEESECIEVIKVPVGDFLEVLKKYSSEGHVVDARVYSYALALHQPKGDHEVEKCDQLPG